MQHNPQALHLRGTPVRITSHRRRVGSEFATLIDVFWRGGGTRVVLRLPSGQRTAAPASWTDLRSDCLVAPKTGPEILPSALLELAQCCRGLRSARRQASRKQDRTRSQK